MEAKSMLAVILQRTRMEWVEGQRMDVEDPDFPVPVRNNAITLRPLYDMMVRVYAVQETTR
jgi:hypothetical protein